jgi:pSer/pThr/pTyr-binding forkhead associated (FHA) protein
VDCPSCGATAQHKARCEACGFAFPADGGAAADDDVLSLFLGLVCPSCDGYNDPGTASCVTCGATLEVQFDIPPSDHGVPLASAPPRSTLSSPAASAPPSWMTPPTGQPLATNMAMKKVDLAVMADAPPVVLAAPSPTPLPTRSPLPPSAPPPAAVVSSPPVAAPSSTPTAAPKPPCWRCHGPLEPNDKFCRQCGARVDAASTSSPATAAPLGAAGTMGAVGAAAAATSVMAALKLPPVAPAPAPASSSSTMVIPAMKVAASAPVAPPPGHQSATATMVFGAVTVERAAKLILVRGHTQYGSQWRLQASDTLIGRSEGMVLFPEDTAIAPRHARLVWRGAELFLEPLPSTNGVFVRLRQPARLQPGDEFLVGAQRLRVLADDDRPRLMQPGRDDTALLGSVVKPTTPICLARVSGDPLGHEVYFRPQRLLTIGRAHCDILFPQDGFVSERHAQLTAEDGGVLTLEDLGSRNGTYVRARSPRALAHGDLLLMGDQVLRIELPNR